MSDAEDSPPTKLAASVLVDEMPSTDPALARRVLARSDAVVLVGIVVITTLQFLDKNCLSYAAILGLKADTHLAGQQYSWLGSVFYFGYLVGMPLASYLVVKLPVGRLLGAAAVCWGTVLMLMATCRSFAALAAVRFFLGVLEAPSLPCSMVLISRWWTSSEQPLRAALWYNTLPGIFGGPLAFAIDKIRGPLETWRYMFIIYGAVTIVAGVLAALAIPDAPDQAWFLSEEEKLAAAARLAQNLNHHNLSGQKARIITHKQGLLDKSFRPDQCLEALRSGKYWVLILFAFAQAITAAGITNFNTLIIQGFGYSTEKTTLLAAPQAAVGIAAQVLLSLLAYYVRNIRCLLWMLGTLPALAGAVMIRVVDVDTQRNVALAGVYLMGFYNVGWVMAMAIITANTRGSTKRPFVNSSVGVALAVGEIVGPQFFLESQAPRYQLGIYALVGAYSVMVLTGGMYWAMAVVANKSRDGTNSFHLTDQEGADDDTTDVRDKSFRYSF